MGLLTGKMRHFSMLSMLDNRCTMSQIMRQVLLQFILQSTRITPLIIKRFDSTNSQKFNQAGPTKDTENLSTYYQMRYIQLHLHKSLITYTIILV